MRQRFVVREKLKFQARSRLCRIGIVGNEIATAQLKRVHADLGGGKLDQAFRDSNSNRVANCTVLAHHVLVLKHDARLRAVIRAFVRAADQVHDLVGLDAAGARIDGVGADPVRSSISKALMVPSLLTPILALMR